MPPSDRELLPKGFSTTQKKGAYAQFDEGGQLLHYGWYVDGQPKPGTYALTTDPVNKTLRVDSIPVPEFFEVEDGRTFEDGEETFENDPEVQYPPADEQRRDFIQRWAKKADGAPPPYDPTCAFCGKKQAEVKKLMMGPSVGICNECMGLCSEILGTELEPYTSGPSLACGARCNVEFSCAITAIATERSCLSGEPLFFSLGWKLLSPAAAGRRPRSS